MKIHKAALFPESFGHGIIVRPCERSEVTENPHIPQDYRNKLDKLNPASPLDTPWIADKEEFDEVVGWYEQVMQGYSIEHIARNAAAYAPDLIKARLRRLYLAAVPSFLETVRIARIRSSRDNVDALPGL